jgi:hypothetical protein
LLVGAGGGLTLLWFQDYPRATAGAPPPAAFISFAATFLAFPFADLAGVGGGIAGSLLFLALLWPLARSAWRRNLDPVCVALFAAIAYVAAAGVMTAYGRAADVANAALVARYATPSLLAWAALALLWAARLQHRPQARRWFSAAGVAIALALLPAQVLGTTGGQGPLFVHGSLRAALALTLGVRDVDALARVFPSPAPHHFDLLRNVSDDLKSRGLSTFADPMWDRIAGSLGAPGDGGWRPCRSNIERIGEIPGEPGFHLVQGWAFDPSARTQPRFVALVAEGRVAGLAVGGAPRPDVARDHDGKGGASGFTGYVRAAQAASFAVLCPTATWW